MDASIEYNYKGEEVAPQSGQDLQLEKCEIVKWKIMPFPTPVRKRQIQYSEIWEMSKEFIEETFQLHQK